MRLCRPESIRFRLTMMVGGLIIIPLLILGSLFIWGSFRVERETALAIEQETADRVASEVKVLLQDKMVHLQQLIAVRGFSGLTREQIRELLFEALLYHNDFESLSLYNTEGEPVARVRRSQSLNRSRPDGQDDQRVYELVRSTAVSHWGAVHFHPETAEPHIWIALPVFEPTSRQLRFVLSADFRVKSLWSYFATLRVKTGEEIYLTDADNHIIAHADPSVVLRGEQFRPPVSQAQIVRGRRNRSAIIAVSGFTLSNQPLTVVAQRTTRVAFSPWISLCLFLVAIMGFFLIIGLGTSSLAVRRIVSPIEELDQTMQRIEEGELDCRVTPRGENEIARLGHSFNTMLDTLQSLMREMQAKNDELRETRTILEWELRMNRIIAGIENTLLNREPTHPEVAALTLEGCCELTGSSLGYVSVLEPGTGQERIVSLHGGINPYQVKTESAIPEKLTETIQDCCPDLIKLCADREKPVILNQIDKVNEPDAVPVSNLLYLPIWYRDRLLGRIVLANCKQGYRDRDLSAVEQIGDIYGLAILRHENRVEQERLNRELRQAQKMEAIGTLAGGIAHDFNNILTAILGYGEILAMEMDQNDPRREDVERIMQAGQRAARLVQQILTFSRKEEGERKQVQIQYIIKEAVKMLRSSLPSSIDLRQEIDSNCPPILADATQIHQVLMNLCTNAKDAMGEQGGVLLISLKQIKVDQGNKDEFGVELNPGSYLELRVQDTGTGIDPAIRDKIFDPFFTTKEQGKGTGLGLAVVHGIVVNHDAEICLESEPGQSTAFTIYFPVARGTAGASREDRHKCPRGRGQHILVVDDEPDVVHMLTRVLKHLGYRSTGCTESRKALALMERDPHRFDLLLTDMTMPEMNGVELATRILANRRQDLPVVLTTGFSEFLDRDRARLAGIGFFLDKPLQTDRLGMVLHQALVEVRGDEQG